MGTESTALSMASTPIRKNTMLRQSSLESNTTPATLSSTTKILSSRNFDEEDRLESRSEAASTVESSPTPNTGRDIIDPTKLLSNASSHSMLSLPEFPSLPSFPTNSNHKRNTNNTTEQSEQQKQRLHDRIGTNVVITKQNDLSLLSARVLPMSFSSETDEDEVSSYPKKKFYGDYRSTPPIATVSVPEGLFALPPSPRPSWLTGPPPRAGDWDDATIESQDQPQDQEEKEDEEEPCSPSKISVPITTTAYDSPPRALVPSFSEQDSPAVSVEAMATMKPLLERAARLALLQTRANDEAAARRRRYKNWRDQNRRALLASLQEQDTAAPPPPPTPARPNG